MRTTKPSCSPFCFTTVILTALCALAAAGHAANQGESGRITHLANDVVVQPKNGEAHDATLQGTVNEGSAVRTGRDARVAINFPTNTFVRIGESSLVEMVKAHTLQLATGAIFFHVPAGGVRWEIKTALVNASTSGATFALETYQHSENGTAGTGSRYRLTVLTGTVRLCRADAPADCVTVEASHAMIGSRDKPLVRSIAIESSEWLATNSLITDFPPLSSDILALLGLPASGRMTLAALFRPAGSDAGSVYSASAGTINPANISDTRNEVSPSEERVTICHSGQTLTLPRAAAEQHLRSHPGDSLGACR